VLPVADRVARCPTLSSTLTPLRKIFKPLHPPDALDILAPEAHLGPVDPLTMPEVEDLGPTDEEKRIEQARKSMPGADAMLLIDDFEVWAEKVLSGTAWNYYRSAGE
jgi:L-lactate dehydrogenase (cytochrome)